MKILKGIEKEAAMGFIKKAAEIALNSNCLRSRCGAVIVKDDEIIASGFNSPPNNKKPEICLKDSLPEDFKSDRTCCVHAEQRAIMDGLKNNPNKLIGSRIYFIRIDNDGRILESGDPYCTICSKMVLDVGISEFVLYKKEGVCVYDSEEYNNLSFE